MLSKGGSFVLLTIFASAKIDRGVHSSYFRICENRQGGSFAIFPSAKIDRGVHSSRFIHLVTTRPISIKISSLECARRALSNDKIITKIRSLFAKILGREVRRGKEDFFNVPRRRP